MANTMTRASIGGCVAVTGRFQPFHNDHLDLVMHALSIADQVLIGVTNADSMPRVTHAASAHRHLDSANPFNFAQRRNLIEAALVAAEVAAQRYRILPFPLDQPALWPAILPLGARQLVRIFSDWEREKLRRFESAGYATVALMGDADHRVSGSDIRAAMRAGRPWRHWVPAGTRELLVSWQGVAA
jgi:cytidyltransferase-like protein